MAKFAVYEVISAANTPIAVGETTDVKRNDIESRAGLGDWNPAFTIVRISDREYDGLIHRQRLARLTRREEQEMDKWFTEIEKIMLRADVILGGR